MPALRYYENRRSFDTARKIRETFVDREMTQVDDVAWNWPRALRHVGVITAVMYSSDKWKKPGNYEDYKHIAEAHQDLLVCPGFAKFDDKRGLHGDMVDLNNPLPDAFAVLAPILGIQAQFFDESGDLGDDFYQVNIPRAMLGAAKHPKTGETFLLIYTARELCAIVTGTELDVEKDGIVG